MVAHNRAVNGPLAVVESLIGAEPRLELGEDRRQRAVRGPPVEMGKHRFPRSQFVRQIAPGGGRPQNPAEAVEGCPCRHRGPTPSLRLRE